MKKISLLIAVVISIYSCNTNTQTNVEAVVKGLGNSTVYVMKVEKNGPVHLDTVKIINGKFGFSTRIESKQNFRVLKFEGMGMQKLVVLFLGNGENVNINTEISKLGSGEEKVTGSDNHKLYLSFMQPLKEVEKNAQKILKEHRELSANIEENKDRIKELEDIFKKLSEERNDLAFKFVQENTDNNLSSWVLTYVIQTDNLDKLTKIHNSLEKHVKESTFGKMFDEKLTQIKKYNEQKKAQTKAQTNATK